jgi:hypothetical protein
LSYEDEEHQSHQSKEFPTFRGYLTDRWEIQSFTSDVYEAKEHLVLFFGETSNVKLQLVDPDPRVPDKIIGGIHSEIDQAGHFCVKKGGKARVCNFSKDTCKIGVCKMNFTGSAQVPATTVKITPAKRN